MENLNFLKLNLPITIDINFNISNRAVRELSPFEILNTDSLNFFFKNKLYPQKLLLFSTDPGESLGIHIDGNYDQKRIWALNFVYNSSDSKMSWYSIINHENQKILSTTESTPYIYFDEKNVIKIDELNNFKCALVRVDIPHRVVNFGTCTRYCLSFRFSQIYSWKEIIDVLKVYEDKS